MEILPEVTLKIGLALKNSTLTRSAYSILVSEEALRVGAGKFFKESSQPKKHTPIGKDVTRFGRIREDLDEDTLNSIQHAGRLFSTRIEETLGELLSRETKWFLNIPEYAKLVAFKVYLDATVESGSSDDLKFKKKTINELIDGLGSYARGRILYCLFANLSYQQSKTTTDNRNAENWRGPADPFFDILYNTLSDHERMITRSFWEILRALDWTTDGLEAYTNMVLNPLAKNNAYHNRNIEIAFKHGIFYITMRSLQNRSDSLNALILDAIRKGGFNDGKMPDAASLTPGSPRSTVDVISDRLANLDSDTRNESLENFWTAENHVKRNSGITALEFGQARVEESDGKEDSPLFHLPTFLRQVGQHLRSICNTLLSKGENDFSVLCDTLLCLSDDEYKFLPLWSGGMDDGSGGVFEEEIPPAEKGPIGPGPAFHTGSTANSMVDSDFDLDGGSSIFDTATIEGIQTSLGVEDGFSDHLDRRVVYSEDDFPMEHDPLPVGSHTQHGSSSGVAGTLSGKALAQGGGSGEVSAGTSGVLREQGAQSASVSRSGPSSHIDGDDFFNVEDDEEDLDMDSDGTLTETE
jgi:hypothetical protein